MAHSLCSAPRLYQFQGQDERRALAWAGVCRVVVGMALMDMVLTAHAPHFNRLPTYEVLGVLFAALPWVAFRRLAVLFIALVAGVLLVG